MLTRSNWRALLLTAALPVAGCSDLVKVTNPGPINDEALNRVDAIPGLINGMAYNAAYMVDRVLEVSSLVSGEMGHSGSYPAEGLYSRGILHPEDVNGIYGRIQQARWVSETGADRIKELLGSAASKSPDLAKAYLYAGIANRVAGENICQAVIDGGAVQDRKVFFQRADSLFTLALTTAQAAAQTATATAALAGRAQARAGLGQWDQAAADAKQVPTSFRLDALFNVATTEAAGWNDFVYETYNRYEYTVQNTEWASLRGDARVPWDTARDKAGKPAVGPNGTLALQQKKYKTLGDAIAIEKGTEMRLIEAEAALRKGDIAGATTAMNAARAFYGLAALPQPASSNEAWVVFERERGATLWLEGRRLFDLSRWYAATGPEHTAATEVMKDRAKCIPLSQDEMASNPNVPKPAS